MQSRLRISFGLAIVAAVTLMLELVLMRAFDAMMNAEMSHLIITCAMFSFGLSGAYASLRPLPDSADPDRYIGTLSAAFGGFALLLLPLLNANPFNYSELSTSTGEQAVYFAFMYLTLMIPFFLAGLIFTTVFSRYASNIRTLYCFDLCGAAIGSVMFVPFIPSLGPGGLLFWAMALSLGAAVLFYGKLGGTEKVLLLVAVGAAIAPLARTHGYFDFADHENKRDVMRAKQQDLLETTRWDPVAKIEIINSEEGLKKSRSVKGLFKHVAYDGGEQSSRFYRFDGNLKKLRARLERSPKEFSKNFWNRSVVASHWLRADSNQDVLVIGSAGGQETKAALVYNPRSVDTVEMVKAVVDLATNEYSAYIGNIFKDPRVHPHVGEGRTYLRSANKKFDIIQIFSNHTSSSMAAGAGRGVYLQTVEAYKEYFSGLKPGGIFQVNHHFYPRVITTAAAAWREMGRTDFRKHVIVYERRGVDPIPLVLMKMTPWTEEEVSKLNGLMLSRRRSPDKFRLVEDPTKPSKSVLSADFYSGKLPPELVAKIPYRITPPTDDRPYFNFVRKHLRDEKVDPEKFVSASIAGLLSSETGDRNLGVYHHVLSGAIALLFAVGLILVPMFFRGKRGVRWDGEFSSLFYFSCLGAAFIIVELTLAAVFMKLIGVPLYTYSAVIFTILAAAGIGSFAASSLGITPQQRFWLPQVGTIVLGILLLLTQSWVFDYFLASTLAVRLLVTVVMVFPIAFFMGMCLPLGILAIEQKPRGAIAWAWGMNGLFTTIGGLGTSICSMFWGYRITMLIALAIYGLSGLAFARLRKFASPAPAGEPTPESEDSVDASAMA